MYKFGHKVGMVIALLLSAILSLTFIYWIVFLCKALLGVLS